MYRALDTFQPLVVWYSLNNFSQKLTDSIQRDTILVDDMPYSRLSIYRQATYNPGAEVHRRKIDQPMSQLRGNAQFQNRGDQANGEVVSGTLEVSRVA